MHVNPCMFKTCCVHGPQIILIKKIPKNLKDALTHSYINLYANTMITSNPFKYLNLKDITKRPFQF